MSLGADPSRLVRPVACLLLAAVAVGLARDPGAGPAGQRAVAGEGRDAEAPAPSSSHAAGEPWVQALDPLGPLRAVVSAILWTALLDQRIAGRTEETVWLAEGLLRLHPRLDRVRVHLATALVVTEAPRAPDAARHAALVTRGLSMLENGLEQGPSPVLHGALGSLIALQRNSDPRFNEVAARYFGTSPTDIAIQELRAAGLDRDPLHALLLVDLLVERGQRALDREQTFEARRDLREAESLLGALPRDVLPPGSALDELRLRLAEQAAPEADGS